MGAAAANSTAPKSGTWKITRADHSPLTRRGNRCESSRGALARPATRCDMDVDRLQFLIRRFRQIAPESLKFGDPALRRNLQCWLNDDVNPVLEGYLRRPRFRDLAAWPLRTLRP